MLIHRRDESRQLKGKVIFFDCNIYVKQCLPLALVELDYDVDDDLADEKATGGTKFY